MVRLMQKILWCLLFMLNIPVYADDQDDLPTLDALEARHSEKNPVVTLPNDLITVPVIKPGEYHVPPRIEDLRDSKYAEMVNYGRNIFIDTKKYARRYVGNGLNCSSCHLQEGRKPYAAPMWAAFPLYPMYREKNKQVVSFQERIQECFRYSLNGMAPALDTPEVEALTVYAHWLSTGIPQGAIMPGRGFVRIDKTYDPSVFNGEVIYKQYCAMCHGDDLLGKKFSQRDGYMFPPLAGKDAWNKGAGMHKVKTCASFVQANMPLGRPFVLNDDEALEVCVYIYLQDRPWHPKKSWFENMFMQSMDG